MTDTNAERLGRARPLAWGGAATLILLPLLLMKLADPRAWELADLPFAFVMVVAVGLAFEFAVRIPATWAYRAGAAVSVGAALLLIFGNLAVGFAGSEDNAINMIFFAVPALALAGGFAVGFRSHGLSIALACAAAGQLAAGLIVYYYGHFTGPLTVTFTALWLASSLLFLRSSQTAQAARDAG